MQVRLGRHTHTCWLLDGALLKLALPSQAVRDQLVLECSTSIISAFALGDGRLIYQNNLSKAWFSGHGEQGSCLTRRADSPVPGTVPTSASVPWGGLHIPVPPLSQASGSHADHGEVGLVLGPSESAAGGRVTEGCTAHMLAHVFALEPQKLACMLQELSQSGSGNWKGDEALPVRMHASTPTQIVVPPRNRGKLFPHGTDSRHEVVMRCGTSNAQPAYPHANS